MLVKMLVVRIHASQKDWRVFITQASTTAFVIHEIYGKNIVFNTNKSEIN